MDACYYNLGEEVINALINAGANVKQANRSGATPLSMAIICNNDISVIKKLIQTGSDVNSITECGSTPLIFAIREKRSSAIITALIQAGAKVNTPLINNQSNFDGFTPLHFAVMTKQQEIACILARNNALVFAISTRSRKTPLDLASIEMREAILNARKGITTRKTSKQSINNEKSPRLSFIGIIKRTFSTQQIVPKVQ